MDLINKNFKGKKKKKKKKKEKEREREEGKNKKKEQPHSISRPADSHTVDALVPNCRARKRGERRSPGCKADRARDAQLSSVNRAPPPGPANHRAVLTVQVKGADNLHLSLHVRPVRQNSRRPT